MKKLTAALAIGLSVSGAGAVGADSPAGMPGVPWPATDALNRSLPLEAATGPLKPDRFVGIFYFLWHNNRGGQSPHWNGPYDISRILAKDPGALSNPDSPYWGPIGAYHYWGEPLYGYYLSTDPWVLRRHAQLLADAGIDTLIFDTTNALTYREVYLELCQVFAAIRAEGGRTPQLSFMVNTKAGETAEQLFREFYEPGLHPDLWFRWQGKPLLLCDPEQASPRLREFFTLRRAHWPFTMVNTPYAWHWEAAYPQPYGYTDAPEVPEQVNVSVAQNLRRSDGKVTNMSSGEARGRSFHDGRFDAAPGAVNHGYNFEEQWQRAFELDPPFVMVTGWNEWIAGRWGQPDGPLVFVDQFDQECSRDIEPVKGNHGDNYYWQLIANVRRFKGAPALPVASRPTTIDLALGFDQWAGVQPDYLDHQGETAVRNYDGAAGLHYLNRTGRHDLLLARVARDQDRVYFHLRTRESLSADGLPPGLELFIDADADAGTGWEGYEFRVTRSPGAASARLESNAGGWHWQAGSPIACRAAGNDLHLAVPRTALGLPTGVTALQIDFKWIDNAQSPGNIMDVYVSGDAAPEGRFRFRYRAD
ncbi:MAG: hypothetical protein H7A45_07920 [Verrucomicrobiales bacterium]|nr:hypothetical protein [Verrucomicrobiales bacterium]MCP5527155.1 hypothetical protein [Verrucomicrobiales bacterium]